ncbi:hypothetical protein [Halomonas sp. BN3-1]|uniref:hypothetical protein n=1 Tax=Halomonas sp. BN3-1 TaxID=2082393 RepID=UPI0013B38A7C|nr:hypothetical protein [Halomonas sp. BN3-1]
MKAGDIIATTGNRFVQVSTISRWSHVAIAIDDKNVVEAIPSGVVIRTLSECTEKSKSAYLFERPSELKPEEQKNLKNHAKCLKNQGLKYNLLRAGYAGLPHLLWNAFCFLSVVTFIGGIVTLSVIDDMEIAVCFFLLTVISIFIGLPLSRLSGMPNQVNEWLDRNNAPAWLKNNVKDQYCSQLVVNVDREVSPSFSVLVQSKYEARPKDVVSACKRQGWKKKI